MADVFDRLDSVANLVDADATRCSSGYIPRASRENRRWFSWGEPCTPPRVLAPHDDPLGASAPSDAPPLGTAAVFWTSLTSSEMASRSIHR
jgi:hypothetical protein